MVNYTNAQFRSILFGLGYLAKDAAKPGLGYPVTTDNSALTGPRTLQAIKNFQSDFQLLSDGVVGSKTMAKAAEVIRILQHELNLVVDAGLTLNQPFYGPKTVASVKKFQGLIDVAQTGIATIELRVQLDEIAKAQV
jgi:peptidoglycan hydrolase-like protein with peptidoglycan-binding domain